MYQLCKLKVISDSVYFIHTAPGFFYQLDVQTDFLSVLQ